MADFIKRNIKNCFARKLCVAGSNDSTISTEQHSGCYNVMAKNQEAGVSDFTIIGDNQLYFPPQPKQESQTLRKQAARANLQEVTQQAQETGISQLPLLFTTPEKARKTRYSKLTSTVIVNETHTIECSPNASTIQEEETVIAPSATAAFINFLYESPRRNSVCDDSSDQSISWSSENTQMCLDVESADFRTANSNMFTMDESSNSVNNVSDLYICRISYTARSPAELTIRFTDRLKLVQVSPSNPDWCLVQNVDTSLYGFVPMNCILEATLFMSDLKHLNL